MFGKKQSEFYGGVAQSVQQAWRLFDNAQDELERLRAAIRKHRDYRGDDRCHDDDDELYAVLPEGWTPRKRDTAVTLENCKLFIACRQNPNTEYVSPEREIERLRRQAGWDWVIILGQFTGIAFLIGKLWLIKQ